MGNLGKDDKMGWSQSGPMRTALISARPLDVGIGEAGLSCQSATFPVAQLFTVQIGIQPPSPARLLDGTAEILWSVGGNTIRRVMSIGNGATISGAGHHCKVVLRDTTPAVTPVVPPVVPVEYVATINITPGTRPTARVPILRTLAPGWPVAIGAPYVEPIAAAGSATWPVPTNAGVILLDVEVTSRLGAALAPDSIIVGQVQSGTFIKTYHPLREPGFVPLSPGADGIIVTNNSAATVDVSIIFGIDG